MSAREAKVSRRTGETDVKVTLNIDGEGRTRVETGVPFFDHMLTLLGRHALFNLEVKAEGDVQVDGHHTVEDTGICLGQALKQAIGDGTGIERYGWALVPMDEALVQVAVDISGRPGLYIDLPLPASRVGDFDAELVEEFLRGLVNHGAFTCHVRLLAGRNTHHCIEAVFKALARALRQAVAVNPRVSGVPSTKGNIY